MRLAVDSKKATAKTSSKSHARRPARRTRRPGGDTAAQCDDKLHEREKWYCSCMSVDRLLRRGGVAEKSEIGGMRAISEAVDFSGKQVSGYGETRRPQRMGRPACKKTTRRACVGVLRMLELFCAEVT